MLMALSDGAWATIGVIGAALIAALSSLMNTIISARNRKEVKQARTELTATRAQISVASAANTADHGTVAMALTRLTEEVHENHRRSGERFERIGQRLGDLANRQEQTMQRIDGTNERIDDVIKAQRDHLQHHIEHPIP